MLAIDVRTANGFVEASPYTPCEPFDLTTLSIESNGDVRFCAKHAGIPGKDGADDTIGNLNTMSVAEAVSRLIGVVALARRRRVEAIATESGGWSAC